MNQPFSNDVVPTSPEPLLRTANAEIAQAKLSLLMELEASLQSSQRALLARDVACLEQSSGEQTRLLRALQIFWPAHAPISDLERDDLAGGAELQAAQLRVLHLGRVQAALLARGQRWLRTIENLLAGPTTNYAPSAHARVPLGAAPPLRERNPRIATEEKECAPCPD